MADENKGLKAAKAGGGDEDLRAVVEAQAKQIEDLRIMLMAALKVQAAVTPDTLWADQHKREMAIKAELDKIATYNELTTNRRNQLRANELNPTGKRLYKVAVGWCPQIIVRADDQVQAKAYYDKLCGILAVNPIHGKGNEYNIAEVTDDPDAKKAVEDKWEYKPALAA